MFYFIYFRPTIDGHLHKHRESVCNMYIMSLLLSIVASKDHVRTKLTFLVSPKRQRVYLGRGVTATEMFHEIPEHSAPLEFQIRPIF